MVMIYSYYGCSYAKVTLWIRVIVMGYGLWVMGYGLLKIISNTKFKGYVMFMGYGYDL